MRCKTSYFFIGLVTFLIGCSAVILLFNNYESPKTLVTEFPVKVEEKKTETKIEKAEIPFNPQIKGLEDFPEREQTKYKTKLVDVENHFNSYRKDEVVAKTGENWLGLYIDSENSYLKNAKVKILLDKEISFDEERWVSIKLERSEKPFILIKNSKQLEEGKVTTLFHKISQNEEDYDDSNVMNRNFSRDFQLNDRSYKLIVKDAETKSGEKALALVLETENESQVVTYGHYSDGDFLGNLLWVGDLDNDGKLDFYMNFNNFEKGYFDSKLYLSSEAEKGQLVKEVAEFFTAGC